MNKNAFSIIEYLNSFYIKAIVSLLFLFMMYYFIINKIGIGGIISAMLLLGVLIEVLWEIGKPS
jgi:hypothetical protein